jgi:hypothetical protein
MPEFKIGNALQMNSILRRTISTFISGGNGFLGAIAPFKMKSVRQVCGYG